MSLQRSLIGVFFLVIGVILIFMAIAMVILGTSVRGSGIGIIIIGPIPLVLSGGADAILIITAISIIIIIAFFLLILRRYAKYG